MKQENKTYCDTSKVSIREITSSVAKQIIVKKHYTHAWSSCRYSLGIFYQSDESTQFTDSEKLIGCMVFGHPVGRQAVTSISELLTKDNVLELTRLYCDDGYGTNIESYSLGQAFKWFKENDKKIKVLISYADNGQNHLGGIYQATNWLYQGVDIKLIPSWSISLTKEPYDWIHSRTIFATWKGTSLEHLQTELGKQGYKEFWRRVETPKHRYLQILVTDKKEKKQMIKSLKHRLQEYPKNTNEYNKEVEHILTITPNNQSKIKFW